MITGNAQAQIRKLFAERTSKWEGYASTLIPKPALLRKRLEMTGKDITLVKYAAISLGIVALVAILLMFRGAPFFLSLLLGTVLRPRRTALRRRQDDQAPRRQVHHELPRCDRADGARPALRSSDHRDARHCRQRNSRAGRNRVPHGLGQDEDRPHDGGRAPGDRRSSRHARVPVLRHHAGHPARDRRQPRRDAVEPCRRACASGRR